MKTYNTPAAELLHFFAEEDIMVASAELYPNETKEMDRLDQANLNVNDVSDI